MPTEARRAWLRYFRLFAAFARFGLATEMAFRANFLVKVLVEVLWLGILLVFYWKLFENTTSIAGWSRSEYFFFVGCHYALAGVVETFFLSNCTEFAELVRTGDLDQYLLKPIDEQFLITCRWIDWSTMPNILQGTGIMIAALVVMDWTFDPLRLLLFFVLFACGCCPGLQFPAHALEHSGLAHTQPKPHGNVVAFHHADALPASDLSRRPWARPFGWFFTFILPVLVVVNVPAETMVKAFDVRSSLSGPSSPRRR